MIKVQLLSLKDLVAVLTLETITLEQILTVELHLSDRQSIVSTQEEDFGDQKRESNRLYTIDRVFWWILARMLNPATKI